MAGGHLPFTLGAFLPLHGTAMYVVSPPSTVCALMTDASYHRRIVSAPDYSICEAARL